MSNALNSSNLNIQAAKSSKLFRKFLETEQSDSSSSANNTLLEALPQVQIPSQKEQARVYKNREFEQFLRASKKSDAIQQNNTGNSATLNNQLSSQDDLTNQSEVSHSYFQPPTGQFGSEHANQTEQSINLSQVMGENPKKQKMSPERFYFNPPLITNTNNSQNNYPSASFNNNNNSSSQNVNNSSGNNNNSMNGYINNNISIPQLYHNPSTILEDDREMQAQSENLSSQQHPQTLPSQRSQHFHTQEIINSGNQQTPQVQSIVTSQGPLDINQLNSFYQIPYQLQNSPQYPHSAPVGSQQLYQSPPQVQPNFYQQMPMNPSQISPMPRQLSPYHTYSLPQLNYQQMQPNYLEPGYQKQQGDYQQQIKENQFQQKEANKSQLIQDTSTKEQFDSTQQEDEKKALLQREEEKRKSIEEKCKLVEERVKQAEEKIKTQQEQVSQTTLQLEKEQLKNKTLEITVADLRKNITQIEVEKTELRQKVMLDVESKSRELQSQNNQMNTLKSQQKDWERREEILRGELEKTKQNLFKEEAAKKKIEDELRDQKNKAKEQQDAMQELQKRQERRDDEVLQLKLQSEQLRQKMNSLTLSNERNSEKLSETQRQQFKDVGEREESQRKLNDYQVRVQTYLVESERLKNENYSLQRQLHESQLRQDVLSNEIYNQRQMLLDKGQKENMLSLSLDKSQLEVSQLRSLVVRLDTELKDSKNQNNRLVSNLADIASSKQQQQQLELVQELLKGKGASALQEVDVEGSRTSSQKIQASDESGQQQQTLQQSQRTQVNQYQRGRIVSDIDNNPEEETKVNFSPGRLRFRPKDNGIFGGGGEEDITRTMQYKQREQRNNTMSPIRQVAMVKAKDHDFFKAGNYDDYYQRNPMKIGSISPPRNANDMIAAGGRKRMGESQNNGGFNQSGDKDQAMIVEQNISKMNLDKQILETELKKIEDIKRKSGADLRRKGEVSREIQQLETSISQQRQLFRQLNSVQ